MMAVPRLLIVHHTPSPPTVDLFDAVVNGASHPDITGVEVVRRAAPAATAFDLLAADAVVLGTPADIAHAGADHMSGAAAREACAELGSVLAAAIMPAAG
jgi:hypothetical protein